MFAVVTISGKQYTVKQGDVIDVDKIEGKAGDIISFDHVLLTSDKGKVAVGTPVVKGAVVKVKVVEQFQGEKIAVRRYKQKVRYRRHIGFRAQLTKLEVVSIG